MLFKEYTYSVLIVSSSEKFSSQLAQTLPENEFGPVTIAKNAGEARRRLVDRSYDTIFLNAPLADEFGTKLALDIASSSCS